MFTIFVVMILTAMSAFVLSAVMAKNLNVSSRLRGFEDMEQMMSVRRGGRTPDRARRTWPDARSTSERSIAG